MGACSPPQFYYSFLLFISCFPAKTSPLKQLRVLQTTDYRKSTKICIALKIHFTTIYRHKLNNNKSAWKFHTSIFKAT